MTKIRECPKVTSWSARLGNNAVHERYHSRSLMWIRSLEAGNPPAPHLIRLPKKLRVPHLYEPFGGRPAQYPL
jgi:hypothetical protein